MRHVHVCDDFFDDFDDLYDDVDDFCCDFDDLCDDVWLAVL